MASFLNTLLLSCVFVLLSDWGGHTAAGGAPAAGAAYEERRGAGVPPGVGYREAGPTYHDEPREREYREREYERERHHEPQRGRDEPGFIERMMGKESAEQRREREWRESGGRGVGSGWKTESAPASSTYVQGTGYRAPAETQTVGSTPASREPSHVDEPIPA